MPIKLCSINNHLINRFVTINSIFLCPLGLSHNGQLEPGIARYACMRAMTIISTNNYVGVFYSMGEDSYKVAKIRGRFKYQIVGTHFFRSSNFCMSLQFWKFFTGGIDNACNKSELLQTLKWALSLLGHVFPTDNKSLWLKKKSGW